MANKTRGDILSQVYQYLPQMNQTSKVTMLNNLVDLAVEEISNRHNFRSLKATAPDTATMTAGQYYVDLTGFATMGGTAGYLKDILEMRLTESGKGTYSVIKYLDDKEFHDRAGYIDYASATQGAPSYYTRVGDRLLFNCPADKAYIVRAWYQKYHPPFSTDTMVHQFEAKSNMMAFHAIVYMTLLEAKNSLNSFEFPQELQAVGQMAEMWVQKLIGRDMDIANEEFEMGTLDSGEGGGVVDPYGWVP
jgi:hypothetical protein